MIGYTQSIIPLSIEIQCKIIEKYGFPATIDGLVRFNNSISVLINNDEKDNGVRKLFEKLRTFLTTTESASVHIV